MAALKTTIFIALTLFLSAISAVLSEHRTLVVNALGVNTTDSFDALKRVIDSFDDLNQNNETAFLSFMNSRVLFAKEQAFNLLPEKLQAHVKNDLKFDVKFYSSRPLRDRNIGRPIKIVEQVTSVLESLLETAKTGSDIYALSYSNRSVPIPTKHAVHSLVIMESFGINVLLLGKTRRLSSVSDWHDLQVAIIITTARR